MMGLFVSCIFSAVLRQVVGLRICSTFHKVNLNIRITVLAMLLIFSTLSSGLNSLAALTWTDFLSRISFFDRMGPVGKGRVTCILGKSSRNFFLGHAAFGIGTIQVRLMTQYSPISMYAFQLPATERWQCC
jgi:hypothetical protein